VTLPLHQSVQATAAAPMPAAAPSIEQLLPAAAHALETELGRVPGELRVLASNRRAYSMTWEIGAGDDRYILKWLPLRAWRELQLTRLTRELFAGEPFVRTPAVACSPTSETFLVEKLPGVSLQSVCTSPPLLGLSAWLDSRCRLLGHAGMWLRRFHDAERQLRPAPLQGVKAYAMNRQPALTAIGKELADEFWRVLDSTVAAEPVRVHGDFTPHNLLVHRAADQRGTAERVAVIDMAGISEFEFDTHCFDAAAMVVGLEESWRRRSRNHLRFFPSTVNQMIAAFLGASGINRDDGAFPICYAVRHLTRVYNILRKTGKVPGAGNWHVQRLRLALERPEIIRDLSRGR
jgi:hypothetical protein